ncbi:hypothetical protein BT96DRAFT_996046 [Gymnopus androsaceus JB14]|uniref:Uncharacterized protein n=1 Tax=Gymnopus androsaceus JB14 TaxID=1447944 RepID=A0A6A4HHQ7_9AGAR|nr:hypothetical protein BT96DRAFT_996046 [Gymnopus androsaceus JB14]
MRGLLTGITGVWQVAFKGTWCVSASNRNDVTVLDMWDFLSREGDVEGGGEGVEGGLGEADPLSAFVEEVLPPEEEEVPHMCTSMSTWTWQDKEWLGKPPSGNEVTKINEDEDGGIELISIHGEGEGEEDQDIVYTGRRAGNGVRKRRQREMQSVSIHGEGEGEEDQDIVYTGRRAGNGVRKRRQREMQSVSCVSVPPSSVSTSSAAS